jgi:hypothetical protein
VNNTVADALAADLVTIERSVDVPTGALGYGTDLSCVVDLTPDCAEVDPMSQQALIEALLRRLSTSRGQIVDAPDYGLDLRARLNQAATPAGVLALRGDIRNECTKDDRVADVSVELDVSDDGLTLSIALNVEGVDPGDSFDLTFAVGADGIVALDDTTDDDG